MFGISVFRYTLPSGLQFAGQMQAKSLLSFVFLDNWNQIRELGVEFSCWHACETSTNVAGQIQLLNVWDDMFCDILPECPNRNLQPKKKKNTERFVLHLHIKQLKYITKDTIGPCSSRSLNSPSS